MFGSNAEAAENAERDLDTKKGKEATARREKGGKRV
jgi:hypothetical protein